MTWNRRDARHPRLRPRHRRARAAVRLGALFFMALAAFARPSAAQSVPPAASAPAPTPGWSADAFVPAERGSRWFYAESIDLRGHGRMALGAVATYAYRPVAIRDDDGDVRTSLLRNHAVLHNSASFVFADRIRLGFDVPLQITADGKSASVRGTTYSPAADETAVGDVRLAMDLRLFGRHAEGLTGAIGGQLFVPSGSPASFSGDGEPHVRSRFMLAYEHRSIALAGMTGVHLRGRDEPWAEGRIGSEVFLGVAGGVLLAQGRILVGPELLASTVVSGGAAFGPRTTPIEALFGTRWEIIPKIRIAAGAGAGLTRSYGAPTVRLLLGIEWVPDDPTPPPPPQPENVTPPDRDGDGVPDPDDACGFVPGVKSEFPERNGCPLPAPEPAPAPDEGPAPAPEPAAPEPR